MPQVPTVRIRSLNHAPVNQHGRYVLYWMTMARRTTWNFALDRVLEWAKDLNMPLVVFEALRCDYPWASDRLHGFVIEGMLDNAARLAGSGVLYYPYLEPKLGVDKGLLAALAAEACVVVTDEFPAFFLPRMLVAAGRKIKTRMEAVDSNGILPLRATERVFPTAYAFRRFLQKNLREHLESAPQADPLKRIKLPPAPNLLQKILKHWPPLDAISLRPGATAGLRRAQSSRSSSSAISKRITQSHQDKDSKLARLLARLPIEHNVPPASFPGGANAAQATLRKFLTSKLNHYNENRNEPELSATSDLSPYLHFGHISAHEVFHRLANREHWSSEKLSTKASGKRTGWWNMSEPAEAFLDQLITWRELGYNFCTHRDDYDQYESLPEWAQKTLNAHARDRRPVVYTLAQLERAETYDELWNAAQRQLLREGRMHNYLRMLWGKKIVEWTASPREALAAMIELNNKYAVDGRNPNSYSGICWCLGRYDRPWGPERKIFGKVRYMSSDNTARKFSLKKYLDKYGP